MENQWTFEKAIGRLEQIVTLLESGKCTLDESMKLFEEGTRLAAFCTKSLKEAEQKILQLTADMGQESGDQAEPELHIEPEDDPTVELL